MTVDITQLPSQLYRTAVLQICTQYSTPQGVDLDNHFLKYLESSYKEEKERLKQLPQNVPESELAGSRYGLFVLATGLFAYGHIEVAEDILNGIPPSGAVKQLALALKAMLPLPNHFDPIKNPELIREWLRNNKTKIRWNEELGKYLEINE